MPWDDNERYYEESRRNTTASGRYSYEDHYPRRTAPYSKSEDSYRGRSVTRDSGRNMREAYGNDSYRSNASDGVRRKSYSERPVYRNADADTGRMTSRDAGYERRSSNDSAYGIRRESRYTYDDPSRATGMSRRSYDAPTRTAGASRRSYDAPVRGAAPSRRSNDRTLHAGDSSRTHGTSARSAAPSRSSYEGANRASANPRRPAADNSRPNPNTGRNASAHRTGDVGHRAAPSGFTGTCVWLFQRINADVRGRRRHQLLPALYLPLVCVYCELLLNLLNGLGLAGFFSKLFFGLSTGMLLGGFALLFKGTAQKIIVRVELFLIGLLFIVQCLIRKEFQVYFPLRTVFSNITGVVGNYSSDLFSSIFSGLPIILLFFLPLIIYWIMTVQKRRRSFVVRVRRIFAFELLLFSFIAWTLGMLTLAIGGNTDSYKSGFEITSSSDTFGLLTGFRLSEKYAIFGEDAADSFDDLEAFAPVTIEASASPAPTQQAQQAQQPEPTATPVIYGENTMGFDFAALNANESDEDITAINSYLSTLTASKQNAYTGLFKGKNLILICAEALSDACIDPQLTPTLYRLMHNGFYFSQAYQPSWGGSTSAGEYSFLTGLVPTNAADTMKDIAKNNNYFTMGSQLNRLGYTSICYHNGKYTYYDRNITHINLGYDQFIAHGNGLESIAGGYPNDEDMISKTLDTYINNQPFSVYYMTCDGHKPYDNDKDSRVAEHAQQVLSVYGNRYQQNTLNYICYQMELEDAVATLVAKLEAAGIADDTVICICSDHYPYGLSRDGSDYIPDLYGYDPQHPWERDRNAIIIWSGSLEHSDKDMACEISAPVYSLDIVPTLSNLFGVEYDSRLLVGRDVFSDEPAFVLWNDGSWVSEFGRYDADEKQYYPIAATADDNAYVAQMSAIVKYKRSFSKLVKNADYYQYIVNHLPAKTTPVPTVESTPSPDSNLV